MKSHQLFAGVIGAVVLAAAACSAGDDSEPTSTPALASTPTASAPTPSASPTAASGPPAIIETVSDAVATGDVEELKSLLESHPVACVAESEGIGTPPICRADETVGDMVEAVIAVGCEGSYVRPSEFTATIDAADALWAAYEFSDETFGPGARYFLIFERAAPVSTSTAYAIITSNTGVVSVHAGCGWDAPDFIEFNDLGAAIIAPDL